MICLDDRFSTTRRVRKVAPEVVLAEIKAEQKPEDQFETVLFLPEGEGRQGEGGLRTQGYFKKSETDKLLITVVTVVFNGEAHLEETILSVINQTYDNVEYIVIDGASTDGTIDIIRKYEHAIDYWVSERDIGIYDAMNKGLFLSCGDGINFLNSGDKYVGDPIGNVKSLPFIMTAKIKRNNKIETKTIKTVWFGMPIPHQAIIYDNHKKERYSLEYSISSDYDYTLKSNVLNKYFSNKKGYLLYDNNGLSANQYWLRDYENIRIIKKHFGLLYSLIFLAIRMPANLLKIIHK
jgi:glycosyltransferase involved in cell wall biosynthesis